MPSSIQLVISCLQGVPLRLEIGPRDIEKNTVRAARRYDGKKEDINRDSLVEYVRSSLSEVKALMLSDARAKMDEQTAKVRLV